MLYEIWNRKSDINGVNANYFLSKKPFKNYMGDIILIKSDDGKVINIECKDILAQVYNIDFKLELDDFIKQYLRKIESEKTNEDNENVNQMSTGNV